MSKMTKTLVAGAVLAASTLVSGAAMAEVSMNVGATSNYIWRGVTQSADDSAISGGIDYSHESGFYAGAWLSSLGGAATDAPGTEFDYYAGFGGAYGDISYDVSLAAITYPQIDKWDFTELGASVSYTNFTLGVNSTIASDVEDVAGSGEMFIEGDLYTYLSASFPLQNDYSVGVTYGSYQFADDGEGGADLNYTHYQLSVTKSAGDFGDVTLAYDANDMDDDTATDYKEDSGKFTVSWSKSF